MYADRNVYICTQEIITNNDHLRFLSMKYKYLFLLSALALVSCGESYELDDTQFNEEAIRLNTEKTLGVEIDPEHTWADIENGSITITADADLDDIVKVQILSESPFGNDEAAILNSMDCQKGDQVTLTYEAPGDATELVAACVSSKGVYYIKVFEVGQTDLSFASAARTRAAGGDYPTEITLGESTKSFNAVRAEESRGEYHNVLVKDNVNGGGNKRYYDLWNDGSWLNDRLWAHKSVSGGSWRIDNGTICRDVNDQGDIATVQSIVSTYLQKKGGNNQINGKANNWQGIAQGNAYFRINNNYLISNGAPTTLIPLQMNTTEGHFNTIYYYYFNPSSIPAGMSEVDYIKTLPKYKAIPGFKGDGTCRRQKEYLLPYYGDVVPGTNAAALSNAIPEGYKIGFLNRKDLNNRGDASNCGSGCIYGDGRLNVEVNHLIGHFFTAMDRSLSQEVTTGSPNGNKEKVSTSSNNGMQWDSPRIGFFSANNRSYMCFEDGADCNFTDMIVEIVQGTEVIEESMVIEDIPGASYLMCFEDRPAQADYDMNDVVIFAKRINNNTIEVGLSACGAEDEVYIMGIPGSKSLSGREIHQLFGIPEKTFANTVNGGQQITNTPKERITTVLPLEDFLRNIYIDNRTTGKTIRMPEKGKSPYAFIVPDKFRYPKEGQSIKSAYPGFLEWVQNRNASRDWYRMNQDAGKIFQNLFE